MISTVLVPDGPDLVYLERREPDVYGCNEIGKIETAASGAACGPAARASLLALGVQANAAEGADLN